MFRQGLISCHKAMFAAKAAMAKVSQGTLSLRSWAQPLVPAVQLLTIPLKDDHRRKHARHPGRCRYYSSSPALSTTARSSFKEDYDEWYSHGRVGSITRPPLDDEMYEYEGIVDPDACSFLLDEIRQEEAIMQQESSPERPHSSSGGFKIEPVEEMIFDSHLNEVEASAAVDGLDDEHYFAFVEEIEDDDFTFEEEEVPVAEQDEDDFL